MHCGGLDVQRALIKVASLSASAAVVSVNCAHKKTPREVHDFVHQEDQLHQARKEYDEMLSDRMLTKWPLVDTIGQRVICWCSEQPYIVDKYEIINLTFITEIEKSMTRTTAEEISTLPAPARGRNEGSDKCWNFQSTWLPDKTLQCLWDLNYKEKKILLRLRLHSNNSRSRLR